MKIFDAKKRYTALILSALIALIMMISVLYMAEEMHHDCSGEDCPVCECIQICESILYETQGALIITIAVVTVIISEFLMGRGAGYILLHGTPVSEKVRMDS